MSLGKFWLISNSSFRVFKNYVSFYIYYPHQKFHFSSTSVFWLTSPEEELIFDFNFLVYISHILSPCESEKRCCWFCLSSYSSARCGTTMKSTSLPKILKKLMRRHSLEICSPFTEWTQRVSSIHLKRIQEPCNCYKTCCNACDWSFRGIHSEP